MKPLLEIETYSSIASEYDILQHKFQFFFQNLLKCNCTPYVIFDGTRGFGQEEE